MLFLSLHLPVVGPLSNETEPPPWFILPWYRPLILGFSFFVVVVLRQLFGLPRQLFGRRR